MLEVGLDTKIISAETEHLSDSEVTTRIPSENPNIASSGPTDKHAFVKGDTSSYQKLSARLEHRVMQIASAQEHVRVAANMSSSAQPLLLNFKANPDAFVPNSLLPLILYRTALPPHVEIIEQRFLENRWLPAWRDVLFSHQLYHSNAHEALGVVSGRATILFGGPDGQQINLTGGDVVVIPAGVARKCLKQSADLLIVGAYPENGSPEPNGNGEPSDEAGYLRAVVAVAMVPAPALDPVFGRQGWLVDEWAKSCTKAKPVVAKHTQQLGRRKDGKPCLLCQKMRNGYCARHGGQETKKPKS